MALRLRHSVLALHEGQPVEFDVGKDVMRKIRIAWKVGFFVIMLVGPALAQNRIAEPAPAVTGPTYDFSTGYTYLTMSIPAAGHVHLDGLDVSSSVALAPRSGATLESSYLRASDVFGTSHAVYVLNTQGGPVFFPFEIGNNRIFVRALAGAALVDGVAPDSETKYLHGWLLRPSFAFGAGFEHDVSERFALRVNGDYLRTSFFDSTGAVLPQGNLRSTVSLVFRPRGRQARAVRN